jgi:Lrp/AsnC family transcriptional regulator for asnA, asnC and gidA
LRGETANQFRNAQPSRRGPVSRAREVDATDQGIIEALQRNGREPFRRIAERVGVSEGTIRARYARLVADGILQVTGVTNPLGLGFEAQAMVGIRTVGSPSAVAEEIGRWEEADYVVVTAGRFDLLVELVCTDRGHLLELTNRLRALDGVVSTETFLYLDLWKQLCDWGTRVREVATALPPTSGSRTSPSNSTTSSRSTASRWRSRRDRSSPCSAPPAAERRRRSG